MELYRERLQQRFVGSELRDLRILNPFVLRSVTPPPESLTGSQLAQVRRIGKRLALGFAGDRWIVIHLMIAGRLKLRAAGKQANRKQTLAVLDFGSSCIHFTEAGSRRRASLHIVGSAAELAAHDRGGLEPLTADPAELAAALRRENHTIKRALTDPGVIAGIGNAYSDEILHAARLSPFAQTGSMSDEQLARLHAATREVLVRFLEAMRAEVGEGFPETVTAFRADMAVHGRYGQPCPVCGAPVQRIRYAENETNYCAGCQTGGTIYADRSLSRLLGSDWPRSLDEL